LVYRRLLCFAHSDLPAPAVKHSGAFLELLGSADKNQVYLWPKVFNFDAIKMVITDSKYTWSLAWTAILTVICTLLSLFMTTICAYPLTYDKLKGKGFINALIIFTMYFNAGTIPTFLLLQNLNFISKPIVLIVPYCLSVFNMIIMRSFFYTIPESLRESAEIDGAGPIRILISIYLPMSTPVIATLALFYAVGRWNGFSDALMFMKDRKYYPIQLFLYNIINSLQNIEIATLEAFPDQVYPRPSNRQPSCSQPFPSCWFTRGCKNTSSRALPSERLRNNIVPGHSVSNKILGGLI
jgi:putative aldouronate transport system permease protein